MGNHWRFLLHDRIRIGILRDIDEAAGPQDIDCAGRFMRQPVQSPGMAGETVSERVRELARHRGVEESEVLQRAIETGVETLYRDLVIGRYLDGSITRAEAVDELGADIVDEVAAAREAIEEDVEWGLHV